MYCACQQTSEDQSSALSRASSATELERLLVDLSAGKKIALLVAPAAKKHFGDCRRLFGLLKNWGIDSFYNVLQYADITIWAYCELQKQMQNKQAGPMIASACPLVNRYVMQRAPELSRLLAPVVSPVVAAAVFLRQYRGVRERFAFLTPCVNKKYEIQTVGQERCGIDYCITIKELQQYLIGAGSDLRCSPMVEFSDRGQQPDGRTLGQFGGIGDSMRALLPNLRFHRESGVPQVFEVLDQCLTELREGRESVDFLELNFCRNGCDGGAGIGPPWPCVKESGGDRIMFDQMNAKSLLTKKFCEGVNIGDFSWEIDIRKGLRFELA